MTHLRQELAQFQKELKRLRLSDSYRLSLFLTWPLRNIWRFFRRFFMRFSRSLSRWFYRLFPKSDASLLQYCVLQFVRLNLRREWLWMRGLLRSRSDHPSVFFFSAVRSGSVYAHAVINRITHPEGITSINTWKYVRECADSRLHTDAETLLQALRKPGFFFGPFREYRTGVQQIDDLDPFKDIGNAKIILHIRDPRDVLTSQFYSVAFSHRVEFRDRAFSEAMQKRREQTLAIGIDAFVLGEAPVLLHHYQTYRDALLSRPQTLLTHYETMVTHIDRWLQSLIRFLDLHPSEKRIDCIIKEAHFDVVENPYSHKRQVKPGDHRRKLRKETIDQLDVIFSDTLKTFGYSVQENASCACGLPSCILSTSV